MIMHKHFTVIPNYHAIIDLLRGPTKNADVSGPVNRLVFFVAVGVPIVPWKIPPERINQSYHCKRCGDSKRSVLDNKV